MLGLPSGMGHVGAEFVPVAAVVVDEVSNLTKAWYETVEDDVAWYFFCGAVVSGSAFEWGSDVTNRRMECLFLFLDYRRIR